MLTSEFISASTTVARYNNTALWRAATPTSYFQLACRNAAELHKIESHLSKASPTISSIFYFHQDQTGTGFPTFEHKEVTFCNFSCLIGVPLYTKAHQALTMASKQGYIHRWYQAMNAKNFFLGQ
jgi:hypothetical protein